MYQRYLCFLVVLVSAQKVFGQSPDTIPSQEEFSTGMKKELVEISAVKSVTEENMHQWASYCGSIYETVPIFKKLKRAWESEQQGGEGFKSLAKKKGKDPNKYRELAEMFIASEDAIMSITDHCDRLRPQYTEMIYKKNADIVKEVNNWIKRKPKLEESDYWETWNILEQYLTKAEAEGQPDRKTAQRVHKKLNKAWEEGHKTIRILVAKELYISMLRNMVPVDSVKAVGKNGSILKIKRTHCHGSFTSILMSQYASIIDMGMFQEIRCVPRFDEPATIPLLEDEAPASKNDVKTTPRPASSNSATQAQDIQEPTQEIQEPAQRRLITKSCRDMAKDFGSTSQYTDLQKKALWEQNKYEGSHFEWKLRVESVDTTFGKIQAQFKCKGSRAFVSDVILGIDDEAKALKLVKGQFYTVHGLLRDWGNIVGLSGKLIEIK